MAGVDLTYAEVGATRGALPAGYQHVRRSAPIGHGRARFEEAADARNGAEALASFRFDDVDITEGISPETYLVDAELPAGDYQILGFMDIDGNGEATGDPDVGDPVTLPIGGYAMQCANQPVTVEFALLLPDGV